MPSGQRGSHDVVVGRIVKPHGIRGEVVVVPTSDVEGRFAAGTTIALDDTLATIASSRPHQGRLLIAFEGVADRTAAEALRGAVLTAPPADVDAADMYFAHELVGLDVVTLDDANEPRWLGTVREVMELPAAAGYDLLEVELHGETWLLPDDDDLVEVGTDADTGADLLVVVDPPPGLLPEDAAVAVEDDAATRDA